MNATLETVRKNLPRMGNFDIYRRRNDRCKWRFMTRMLSDRGAMNQVDQLFVWYPTEQFAVYENINVSPIPMDQFNPSFDGFLYRVYPVKEETNE